MYLCIPTIQILLCPSHLGGLDITIFLIGKSQRRGLQSTSTGRTMGSDSDSFDFLACLESSLSELPTEEILMPWEQGVWKDFFKAPAGITEPAMHFRRPVFKINPALEETVTEPDAKRSKPVVRLVSGWADIIKSGEDVCWQDQKEAKMQTALKRWLDVTLRFSDTIELKVMLQQQANVQAQLRLVRNLLWRKAPGTLLKRVNSLCRYMSFLGDAGIPFPGSEDVLYQFMVAQQLQNVPGTRLSGVMEALRFVEHVMGVAELRTLTSSKRCIGAASTKFQGPQRQASPFTVQELCTLHGIVVDESRNIWDRIFIGSVLVAVYSRSRWNDLQHSTRMIQDRDTDGRLIFLEFTIDDHKCVGSSVFRNSHLHAVSPCLGVVDDGWAEKWLACRDIMELVVGPSPVMPAPNISGAPTSRPLSTAEMKLWVHQLLEASGHNLESRRITSHSCKTSMLSFCAKFGIEWTDRMVLGGHVSHLKSVIIYSRDCLALPLQKMSNMLMAIRDGTFQPDNTRSGRFVEADGSCGAGSNTSWNLIGEGIGRMACVEKPVIVSDAAPIVVSDDEDVKDESGSMPPFAFGEEDIASSDDDLDLTSSSSDEEAAEECPSKRLVNVPKAPDGHRMVQHSKWKTLHLMADGYQTVLLCGRRATDSHSLETSQVRWDTPCCHVCWKKVRAV